MWPPIRRAYAWVHQAARILVNAAGEPAETVRRRLDGLLGAMARHRTKAGPLAAAVEHFHKVTRSYRPGLFHCYAVADLPRTNNGLEQLFGSYRRHERRATGRKANSSATVLRGSVRLTAGPPPGCAARTPAIWPLPIGGAGVKCAPASNAVGMPVCCAPSSAVTL
jgi:hypothetical protein